MARQDDDKGSGSDGSWFLEAVGEAEPSPMPSDAVAALESDNKPSELPTGEQTTAIPLPTTIFDGGTGTSTSTYDHPPGGLDPEAPSTAAAQSDSADLNHVLRTRRTFRWPSIAFGVFLIVIAAVTLLWLPAALKQDAVVVKQSYADASVVLRAELPLGQEALDTITDPASSSDAIAATVPIISQVDSAAHNLAVAAAEPLPRQLPLIPVDEIAELEPLQDTAQINAAQGSDVARQLGYAYVYRTTIPGLLATDELPTTADVATINRLSVDLASSLVDDSSVLSDLPVTEATAEVNALAHTHVARFATWQDEYLTALTEGDAETTSELIAELDDMQSGLAAALDTTMATMRVEIDLQIVELARDLETFLTELTR